MISFLFCFFSFRAIFCETLPLCIWQILFVSSSLLAMKLFLIPKVVADEEVIPKNYFSWNWFHEIFCEIIFTKFYVKISWNWFHEIFSNQTKPLWIGEVSKTIFSELSISKVIARAVTTTASELEDVGTPSKLYTMGRTATNWEERGEIEEESSMKSSKTGAGRSQRRRRRSWRRGRSSTPLSTSLPSLVLLLISKVWYLHIAVYHHSMIVLTIFFREFNFTNFFVKSFSWNFSWKTKKIAAT